MAIYILSFYIYAPFDCAMALSIDGLSNRLSQIESSLLYEVKAKQKNTNYYFKDVLVLFNVNLIDRNNNNIKYNTTIISNGSKIIDIINKNDTNRGTKTNIYESYPNSILIDLSGKYIIPGLFDMHAHVAGVLRAYPKIIFL